MDSDLRKLSHPMFGPCIVVCLNGSEHLLTEDEFAEFRELIASEPRQCEHVPFLGGESDIIAVLGLAKTDIPRRKL